MHREKKFLASYLGDFRFFLCYSGAYGLASRCNFHITPTVVLINVHIVEVHLEMHKKNPGSRIWEDFCFYCVALVHMDWHQGTIFSSQQQMCSDTHC